MEIKYEIVPTDITYYSKEATVGTSYHTIQVIVFLSFAMLFLTSDLILSAISVFMNDGSITVFSVNLLPKALIYFAIVGISYFGFTRYSNSVSRKAANNLTGKNGLFCEHTIMLDDMGFTETTDVNRNFTSWEGVEKITETKNYVAISQRLGSNYFIPKRAFTDENQIKAFVATVSSYIDHASIPPPPDFN